MNQEKNSFPPKTFPERRQPRRLGLTLTLDGSSGHGIHSTGANWPLSAATTPSGPALVKPRTPTSLSAANTPASPSTHLDILQLMTIQSHTPTGTPTNESCPSLASGASSSASLVASGGAGASGKTNELKAVLPEELAKRMRRPKPFLLLDCRPEFMYKMNHIYGGESLIDWLIFKRFFSMRGLLHGAWANNSYYFLGSNSCLEKYSMNPWNDLCRIFRVLI